MVRSALGKVAWVGRTASMVFGLALVLALVFGAASVALGANGGNLILGSLNNAATAVTKLTGTVGGGPALLVENPSTGSGATALELRTAAGKPPMKVNRAVKVANLNADTVDGRDSSQFVGGGGELVFDRTGVVAVNSGPVRAFEVPGVGSIDIDCRDDFQINTDPDTGQPILARGFTLAYTNGSGGPQQVVAQQGSEKGPSQGIDTGGPTEVATVGRVLDAGGGHQFEDFIHDAAVALNEPNYGGHRLFLQVTPPPDGGAAAPNALATFEVTVLTRHELTDAGETFDCRLQGMAVVR